MVDTTYRSEGPPILQNIGTVAACCILYLGPVSVSLHCMLYWASYTVGAYVLAAYCGRHTYILYLCLYLAVLVPDHGLDVGTTSGDTISGAVTATRSR